MQLSDQEIDNLSDVLFKTLVIKMLTGLVKYGHKIKEEVKAMQNEIQKNIQGTQSEGREWDSNQRFGGEGRNKHSTATQ